jgi:hypothetical protein
LAAGKRWEAPVRSFMEEKNQRSRGRRKNRSGIHEHAGELKIGRISKKRGLRIATERRSRVESTWDTSDIGVDRGRGSEKVARRVIHKKLNSSPWTPSSRELRPRNAELRVSSARLRSARLPPAGIHLNFSVFLSKHWGEGQWSDFQARRDSTRWWFTSCFRPSIDRAGVHEAGWPDGT